MRIAIIGDSQSEGLAPWLVPLLEARGDTVTGLMLVRGMSLESMRGGGSLTARARATARGAEAVVVILGGNNQISDRSSYAARLRWFLEEIVPGARLIWWVGPAHSQDPRWGPRHARTRALQAALLGGAPRVDWIDAWPMTTRGVEHAPDGLHFTRTGYRVWARRLIGELVETRWGQLAGAALLGSAAGVLIALVRHR